MTSPVAKVVGVPTDIKDTEEEIQRMCDRVKPDMEQKLSTTFSKFEATTFMSSESDGDGMHYYVRILVADDEAVHVRIYQAPPFTGRGPLLQACEKKSLGAPLEPMSAEFNE